jgi:hypothetical protein
MCSITYGGLRRTRGRRERPRDYLGPLTNSQREKLLPVWVMLGNLYMCSWVVHLHVHVCVLEYRYIYVCICICMHILECKIVLKDWLRVKLLPAWVTLGCLAMHIYIYMHEYRYMCDCILNYLTILRKALWEELVLV